jgi:hypothetical protein
LKHICEEIFTSKNQRKIEELGIKSIGDLLEVQLRLSNGELSELKDEVKEKLVKVANWVSCNEGIDVITSFDEDKFEEFCGNDAAINETLIINDMSTENGFGVRKETIARTNTEVSNDTVMDEEMQVGIILCIIDAVHGMY